MKRLLCKLLTGIFIICPVFLDVVQAQAPEMLIEAKELINSEFTPQLSSKLSNWKTFTLIHAFKTPSLQTTRVTIKLGAQTLVFSGKHESITDLSSKLVALTETGRKELPFPDLFYLNGISSRLTIGDNFLLGEIEQSGDIYLLENLKNLYPDAPDGIIILYKKSAVIKDNRIKCGILPGSAATTQVAPSNNPKILAAGDSTTCRTTEIAVLANSTTYAFHGSNLAATASYIASIYNLSEGDYENDFSVNIKFKINELVVSTSTAANPWLHTDDIYSNLDQFYNWAAIGFKSNNDLTSYWSYTKNFTGGVVGLAYLGFTCTSPGDAAIREYFGTAEAMRCLLSHEHGHNFSLNHDAAGAPYIMAPSVNPGNVDFSPESKAAFSSYFQSGMMACINDCALGDCENAAPLNFKPVFNTATGKIQNTWTNEPGLNGYILRWWLVGNTTVNNVTLNADAKSYDIDLPCNAGKVYRVELAKICSSGQIGGFTGAEILNTSIPTITASGSTSFCIGKTATLTSSISSGNQWYNNNVAIPGATSRTYITTISGSYTVKAITTKGCLIASQAIKVTVSAYPAKPKLTASGALTICNGSSIVLSSSASSGNQWLRNGSVISGATSKTYTTKTAGLYSVKNTNSGGCSIISDTLTIVVNPLPPVPKITASGTLKLCPGGSVTLSSSATTGNQWYKNNIVIAGAIARTYKAVGAGTYSVKVKNLNGCLSTSPGTIVTVSANPAKPLITASGSLNFCIGSSVTLTSNAISGNQWFKNGLIITGATSRTYKVTQSGKYSVKVTNAGGCFTLSAAVTSIVYALPLIPTISFTGSDSICSGKSIVLTSSTATTYQWYKNNVIITGATSKSYTTSAAGKYTVTVGNSTRCKSTSLPRSVTVLAKPAKPIVKAGGPLTLCTGNSVLLTSNTSTGNQWLKDGKPIIDSVAKTLLVKSTGKYSLKLTNAAGCSTISDTFEIRFNPLPAIPRISANGVLNFCTGKVVTLTSNALSANQWYKNELPISGAIGTTLMVNSSGIYKVAVTNESGCTSFSVPLAITVNPLPDFPKITPEGPLLSCSGNKVVLNSNAATGNQWFKNGATITGATGTSYEAISAGQYTVMVTNATGCFQISTAVFISFAANPLQPVISWDGVNLRTIAGYANYKWYRNGIEITGATTNVYTSQESGLYTVLVINPEGCSSLSEEFSLGTPATMNAFSLKPSFRYYPNPARDQLHIEVNQVYPKNALINLYDLYGHRVISQALNGVTNTVNTSKLPAGVYHLIISDGKTQIQNRVIIAR
ncbi:M12 family metallo-peptidase [Flavihumibacter fluvii]|uniref:M12 family metallo-peptidase n=1 Tax=Flavihumibacter fluvii TaxID=2838157 RepID=UPI001BDF6B1F|nr:M12 family metallo-peptidase [Flavihumibacter fluvii]ULQ53803.1 M12 family metallo-peptidase [Flavihumibacter fluvii]